MRHVTRKDNSITVFGRDWEEIQAMQQRKPYRRPVPLRPGVDYGADPLGDGTFRMVPSGDIVSFEERCRRLGDVAVTI